MQLDASTHGDMMQFVKKTPYTAETSLDTTDQSKIDSKVGSETRV